MQIPQIGDQLSSEQIKFLEAFSKSCRRSIIEMVKNSQSGHPGGSLSSIDYFAILYSFIIGQTGEKLIVSNGHISPAVYSVLAEMGYIDKEEVVRDFRKINTIYEGHVTRHVPGIWYGTGPLGAGVSAAAGFAMAEKLKKSGEKVFACLGDGEAQEGQVHEVVNFAKHYRLNNFICFVDYNKVQLTDSLESMSGIDLEGFFEGAGWEVIDCNAHKFEDMWEALTKAYAVKDRPVVLLGHSIMGKGSPLMEPEGQAIKATWHGKAPNPEQADEDLNKIVMTAEEITLIEDFKKNIKWTPKKPEFTPSLAKVAIETGQPIVYEAGTVTDCRTAYGMALLDLAKLNQNIVALTADLRGSVMTKFVAEQLPEQHIEVGIAEQNMVSVSGGMSLDGFIPFCSTFGAFMSSRAKDQARVNDINSCNVKMVATHCGLSVGEDGPTHQAIDDMGSFLGMFNTMVIEPSDPNQTDRIIRYIASHYGNFYVRMGRHKFPVILKEDGSVFYDENYVYEYGKSDIIRSGNDLTIAASGAMVNEALKAREILKESNPDISIEIVAVSSIKKFDDVLLSSIQHTDNVMTIEDHNTISGLGGMLARELAKKNICVKKFTMLGVEEYQLSGTSAQLYHKVGLDGEGIAKAILDLN